MAKKLSNQIRRDVHSDRVKSILIRTLNSVVSKSDRTVTLTQSDALPLKLKWYLQITLVECMDIVQITAPVRRLASEPLLRKAWPLPPHSGCYIELTIRRGDRFLEKCILGPSFYFCRGMSRIIGDISSSTSPWNRIPTATVQLSWSGILMVPMP